MHRDGVYRRRHCNLFRSVINSSIHPHSRRASKPTRYVPRHLYFLAPSLRRLASLPSRLLLPAFLHVTHACQAKLLRDGSTVYAASKTRPIAVSVCPRFPALLICGARSRTGFPYMRMGRHDFSVLYLLNVVSHREANDTCILGFHSMRSRE